MMHYHIPEDGSLQLHYCDHLKTGVFNFVHDCKNKPHFSGDTS